MAVSLSTGGFFMSDYMISDAALAMRMQDMQQEQSVDFAALLDGFDSAQSTETAKPGQVNQPKQSQTEQPDSRISEESTAAKSEKSSGYSDAKTADSSVKTEEDEDKPTIKDTTAEQMTFAAMHAVEIDGNMQEFEEITASLSESAEPVESVPVISEEQNAEVTAPIQQEILEGYAKPEAAQNGIEVPKEQGEEFPSNELTEILKPVDETLDITENAEQPTEQIPVNAAIIPQQAAEVIGENKQAVPEKQETAEKIKVADAEESEEVTAAQAITEAPAEVTAQVAEAVTANPDTQPKVEPAADNRQVKAEPISEQSRPLTETNYAVHSEAKAQTESENSGADTAGSEKSFEVFQGAAEKGEISAPEVRTVTREVPVKAENTEEKAELTQPVRIEQPKEQPRAQRTSDSRTTSVTEELEMLKNAKNKTSQTQEKPTVSTEATLTADTPIRLTRANGESVEVRPSEIIEQTTAKLVETAQTMKEQATEYSLVLNPEELGKIVVKMVKAADGAVSVSIAAENTRTQRILEQHSAAMQENLRDSGVKLEGWQMVRESEQETYAQDYNGSSKNPYYREENHSHSEESEETSFADLIASM